MTSFPRAESDPGLPQMLCDYCCLPEIRVFTKIDFGILLSRPVLPTPLENLRSSHYSDDLLPALALVAQNTDRHANGVIYFHVHFLFHYWGNSQKDFILNSSHFCESPVSLQFCVISGLSLPLASYLPLLVSF